MKTKMATKKSVSKNTENLKAEKLPVFRGQKKKFYDALMQTRTQILEQMKFHADEALDSKNAFGDLNSMSNHMADFGSDNFLHDMELNMITNEGDVLEMIDEAINRLAGDEYGKCMDCGNNISPERLEAVPYARFCIKCKSIRENNGGLRPDLHN